MQAAPQLAASHAEAPLAARAGCVDAVDAREISRGRCGADAARAERAIGEPSAPPSTPNKNKRTVEERSPDKTNTADGAAQPTSPNIAGGKQPRAITYSAAAGGGGGAHSPIDFESMKVAALKTELARRGLDTTGLKRDMLARLKAAHPLPALT